MIRETYFPIWSTAMAELEAKFRQILKNLELVANPDTIQFEQSPTEELVKALDTAAFDDSLWDILTVAQLSELNQILETAQNP